MSRAGEDLKKQLEGMKGYLEAKVKAREEDGKAKSSDLDFLDEILNALLSLNDRMQVLEQELGPSDAFVDPRERGPSRIDKI